MKLRTLAMLLGMTAQILRAAGLSFHVTTAGANGHPLPDITVRVIGNGECRTGATGECVAQVSADLKPRYQIHVSVLPDTWFIQNYPGGAIEYPLSNVVTLRLAKRGDENANIDSHLRHILMQAYLNAGSETVSGQTVSEIESLVLAAAREIGIPASVIRAKLDAFADRKVGLTSRDRALSEMYHRNFREAEALLESNIRIRNTENARDEVLLAADRMSLGKFDLAVSALMDAVKDAPSDPEILTDVGMFCSIREVPAEKSCTLPAIQYLEKSLTLIRTTRPYDLSLEVQTMWAMAEDYGKDESVDRRKIARLVADARDVLEKAISTNSSSLPLIRVAVASVLICSGYSDGETLIAQLARDPDVQRDEPGWQVALRWSQAEIAVSKDDGGAPKYMDLATDACAQSLEETRCRALHLMAAAWGIVSRFNDFGSSELDPFIERHLNYLLETRQQKNLPPDGDTIMTSMLYGEYLFEQDKTSEAIGHFEQALASASEAKIDLTGWSTLSAYAAALDSAADDEDDATRELSLRRKAFEIAKMSRDADTIRDIADDLADLLEDNGDNAGAEAVKKEAESLASH